MLEEELFKTEAERTRVETTETIVAAAEEIESGTVELEYEIRWAETQSETE